MKRLLPAALLASAALVLSACGGSAPTTPTGTPAATETEVSTTQPDPTDSNPPTVEPPTQAPTQARPQINSQWSADEVTVLTRWSGEVGLTVTVWDGKIIDGPTPHPWLGGGDLAITMPNEWQYGDGRWIAVPFRIEAVNLMSDTLSYLGVGGNHNQQTQPFAVLEGVDVAYSTGIPYAEATGDVEPGQSVFVAGYLVIPTDYIAHDGKATWVVTSKLERLDATIIWHGPSERYMPQTASAGGTES